MTFIANYGELKAKVADWLSDDSLSAQIPDFIALGEEMIYDNLRCQLNEKTDSAFGIDAATVAAPVDYLEQRSLSLDSDGLERLDFLSPAAFYATYQPSAAPGTPRFFTYSAGSFVFSPAPGSSFTGRLTYFFKNPAFVEDTDTNDVLTGAPSAYLYASLVAATPYRGNDQRAQTWAVMFDDAIDRANGTAKNQRFPPGQRKMKAVDYVEARWRA